MVSIQERVMTLIYGQYSRAGCDGAIRQLIWENLGDEYVMGSEMCGYNVEIAKRNLIITKRNLFGF